ncbi:recombinase [Nitrosospira sp. Nsp2]|uniref:recombinase family protein n=1 Tax=Nitrosospira sp. Nsp2 TaxID=136548 RepID=UPI000D327822|nr:recombinase family protein [Nitrosospira sp. Nsp2]PTR15254.1 recombinase [Nitrosospira sp. Nsp2]
MDDIQGVRKDGQYLRLVTGRDEDNFHKKSSLQVNESVAALIRKLGETYSQGAIAAILNEKGILRNGKDVWSQYHISRWMKKHHIKAVHAWRGNRNVAHERQSV